MKHGKQVDVLIVGIGTDIVEIARVKRAAAREAFLMRVYTEAERAYCESILFKAFTLSALMNSNPHIIGRKRKRSSPLASTYFIRHFGR